MIRLKVLSFALIGMVSSGSTMAKVTAGEAEQLGKTLTPLGAEKAGNKSGTIPAWTGGITQPIAGYEPGEFHPDPYGKEKAQLKINAKNYQKYKSKLTAGQIALLEMHPTYYINVYPAHRSAAYPEMVYDALKENALTAEIQKYGSGVRNTRLSSPFPIPKSGVEVLWNHTLRFRSPMYEYVASTANTTPSGDKSLTTREYQYFVSYNDADLEFDDYDNKIFKLRRKTLSPAKLAGQMTLVHETLDQVRSPRKSWVYMPGQRRVRRTPDLAYDTADIDSNGIRIIDQVDMFNGAPDHYEWTLVGKQEKFIPYNAYKVHQGDIKIDSILGKMHIAPELLRYELHRVWVVEANLRVGVSHIYKKRRYYFDEDTWQIVLAEEYNSDDKLVQVSEAHTINYYEVPVVSPTLEVTYDLEDSRYYVEGLDNERKPINFGAKLKARSFTSSALRREAR